MSVYFETGKTFFILCDKDRINLKELKDKLYQEKGTENLIFSEISSYELSDRVISSLLLCSTYKRSDDELSYANLVGHLYCFSPKWIKYRKEKGEKKPAQVCCLEITIDANLNLVPKLRTFTSTKIIKDKGRQYALRKNVLVGATEEDKETFVLKQFSNQKSQKDFLNLSDLEGFLDSKVGITNQVVKKFNNVHKDICEISFVEINELKNYEIDRKIINRNKKMLEERLPKIKLNIVDEVKNQKSKYMIEEIKRVLLEKYNLIPLETDTLSSELSNLVLVNNKDVSENMAKEDEDFRDKHQARQGVVVQHITLEDFDIDSSKRNPSLENTLAEIAIKEDILNGKISLFDWGSLELKNGTIFGTKIDEDCYCFMKINSDGSFSLAKEGYNFCSEYFDLIEILENQKELEGIMLIEGKKISIKKTGIITIPELDKIGNHLMRGNTSLRGKATRDELLKAVTDIRGFVLDDAVNYIVGNIGNGMNRTVKDACNVRELRGEKVEEVLDKIFPMMAVDFVRYKQLTVLPFPFKYLREFGKVVNSENSNS